MVEKKKKGLGDEERKERYVDYVDRELKKERKDMIMNRKKLADVVTDKNIDLYDKYDEILLAVTDKVIQAETTLHLIDKLVKKIHKEYPTALITETWEIQNLIKDYKDEV